MKTKECKMKKWKINEKWMKNEKTEKLMKYKWKTKKWMKNEKVDN